MLSVRIPISSPLELPEELLTLIFASVADAPTLRACALVCRAWTAPAQARLFRSVRLRGAGRWRRLVRALDAHAPLRGLVHELRFDGWDACLHHLDAPPFDTDAGPRWALRGGVPVLLKPSARTLAASAEQAAELFPRVARVRLKELDAGRALGALLGALPALAHLELDACAAQYWPVPARRLDIDMPAPPVAPCAALASLRCASQPALWPWVLRTVRAPALVRLALEIAVFQAPGYAREWGDVVRCVAHFPSVRELALAINVGAHCDPAALLGLPPLVAPDVETLTVQLASAGPNAAVHIEVPAETMLDLLFAVLLGATLPRLTRLEVHIPDAGRTPAQVWVPGRALAAALARRLERVTLHLPHVTDRTRCARMEEAFGAVWPLGVLRVVAGPAVDGLECVQCASVHGRLPYDHPLAVEPSSALQY